MKITVLIHYAPFYNIGVFGKGKAMAKGKGLKDEPIEYRKEQYEEKNMVLEGFGDRVSALALYEDIFGDLDQLMPVVIIDESEQKHMVKMSIEEAVTHAKGRNDVLMGGVTYFKQFVSKATARNIYTFIIDMDNVYSGVLLRALQHGWALENGEQLPMPTYIVNSGIGLHLYFVLDKPLPNYKRQTENIDRLYRELAIQQTTRRVYLRKQVQWFGQDFRMAGGCGKDMWENTVFRVGKKWNADKLAKACGLDIHFYAEGEQLPKIKKEKEPGQKQRKGFYTNRKFYDYSLERCRNESVEGWRYTSMCALTVIAWKCKVPKDELEKDLLSLIPIFNKGAVRLVKEKEVYSALKMYNEKAMETTRERLQDWQGWEYKPIKRNGRKRAEHLKRARAVQVIDYPDGEWRNKNGRPLAKQAIMDFVKEEYSKNWEFPRKSEIHKALGISYPTIRKYYDDAVREAERVPTPDDLFQESLDRDAKNWLRQCREEKANENPKTDS